MPIRRRLTLQRAFQAELSLLKRNLMGPACGLPTSSIRYPHRMLQADSSRSRQHARLTKRDQFVSSHERIQSNHIGNKKMISFKALAAAVLLSATAATPAFAQASWSAAPRSSGNPGDRSNKPKNDFNPNGTIR